MLKWCFSGPQLIRPYTLLVRVLLNVVPHCVIQITILKSDRYFSYIIFLWGTGWYD